MTVEELLEGDEERGNQERQADQHGVTGDEEQDPVDASTAPVAGAGRSCGGFDRRRYFNGVCRSACNCSHSG